VADTPLRYTLPSHNLAGLVTPTLVSGTQAPGTYPRDYLPARLYDDNPAHPFKVSTPTFRLLWDFGSPVTVSLVILIHHNFSAGLGNVTLGMGTSSATSNFSQTFVIAAYHPDKFPVNSYLELSPAQTYQYLSLEAASANIVDCSIGEFPIYSAIQSIGHSFLISTDQDDEDHPLVDHKTDIGVSTIYRHGTRLRWLRGDVVEEQSIGDQIRTWNRASLGRGLPFVILPPDREPMFVRWEESKLPRNFMERGVSKYRLAFEEVSRGLYPTPSAV
jgi:hypothetical protein